MVMKTMKITTLQLFVACVLVCYVLVQSGSVVLAARGNTPMTTIEDVDVILAPPKPTLPSSWYDPNVTLLTGLSHPLDGPVWYDAPAGQYKQLSRHSSSSI